MTATPPGSAPNVPTLPPPNWYPDPMKRFEYRYWDGARWTDNVSTGGQQSRDHIGGANLGQVQPGKAGDPARIAQQVQQKAGITQPVTGGGGTLLTEPILVVNQKAKILEVVTEFGVFDQHGQRLGSVRQIGQSALKKAMRVLTSYDQFLTHRYEIVDANGAQLLTLTRPRKVFKSRLVVTEIGRAHV